MDRCWLSSTRAKKRAWGAGITPASGFIDSQASLALGALIGLSTFGGVQLIKHRLGVDDALDVSSVHVRNTHAPRTVTRPALFCPIIPPPQPGVQDSIEESIGDMT